MPRKHITVSGRVQGVGFRYHVHLLAKGCHLTGWVHNLDSGDVEIEVQGYPQDIEKFLLQIDRCSEFIYIDRIDLEDLDEIKESDFRIEY